MEKPIETFMQYPFPTWLRPPPVQLDPVPPPVPSWLEPPRPPRRRASAAEQALTVAQFEAAFPDILERICSGMSLTSAVEGYPVKMDLGAFTRWLYKDAEREGLYAEAKKVRAETLTGEMMRHARGESMADIERSKLLIDTYKWLISRHARKEYGDTKTIEMNTTISIKAALAQANERVIDVRVIDEDDDPPRMLRAVEEVDDD